jgi:4-hydroxy-2-oxoheptanedioate aldolase
MAELPRLNGVIKALEEGGVAFVTFGQASETAGSQAINQAPYDGVVYEMEHNIYEIKVLKDTMQYMLNRRQILQGGTMKPAVTPLVRIPPNSGESNWLAKQVLDIGVYGIVWPHIDTVEDARSAISAMRYPKPLGADRREPFGLRGDAPFTAATYWGTTPPEYYARADVWPYEPNGEILAVLMIESKRGISNLPKILEEVPGIGVILTGEGDLCQDMGHPRQYENPDVVSAMKDILDICKAHNVPNGHPHVDSGNVEKLVADGYRFLMPGPERTFNALSAGRKAAGRS